MKKLTQLVVFVCIVFAAYAAYRLYLSPEARPPLPTDANIDVESREGKPCTVTQVTPEHEVKQRHKVKWYLFKRCGELVEVGPFMKHPKSANACPSARPSPVPSQLFEGKNEPFGDTNSFDAKVRDDAALGKYDYCIYVDGHLEYDPTIGIRPFP